MNGRFGEAAMRRPIRRPRSALGRFRQISPADFAVRPVCRLIQKVLVADSGRQGGQRLAVFQFYDAAAVFSGAAMDNRDAVGAKDRGDAAQFGS
jgi:hypothetical protein